MTLLILILALAVGLVVGLPVAAVLLSAGLGLDLALSAFPLHLALGEVLWSAADSSLLLAIPLFILMGELLLRSGSAARAYEALQTSVGRLPGGLLHANIGTAALFATVSGSSLATAGTVGRVAMPQGQRLGYDPRLFAGSIAAGGTLGILVPPSINLIIYGFLTQTSIPRLFAAAIVPALLMVMLFMLVSALLCLRYPQLGGPQHRRPPAPSQAPEPGSRLQALAPMLLLMLLVGVPLYTGFATPSESAALGVTGALMICSWQRRLDWPALRAALDGTLRLTGLIVLILLAARFLNFVLATSGLGGDLQQFFDGLDTRPLVILLIIIAAHILLGLFIETLSMMILSLPVVAPIILGLGLDPVWFGVLFILLVELALITPPVGLNLFVVHAAREHGQLGEVAIGAAPYALAMLVIIVLLIAFPSLALFLPELLH